MSNVVQISRGALMALSAGAGSLYLYVNGHVPPGLVSGDVGRLALQLAAGKGGSAQQLQMQQQQQDVPEYLRPLADQLGELSSEVARLRLQAQYGGSGYYYNGSQGWGVSWTTMATAGGVGVLYLYMRGYSFNDFMYVTKAALAVAVETLEAGIDALGAALESAKRELSYKMGLIEDKIDETKTSLEGKITSEVGDVKRDLGVVGNDVKAISRAQDKVHGLVQSIETQIDAIENKMESANDQLHTANRGIYLLCNVVADSMAAAKSAPAQPRQGATLYEELLAYTRSAVSNFSAPSGASPAPAPASTAAPGLPSAHHGLQLLSNTASMNNTSSRSLVEDMLGRSHSFTVAPRSNNNGAGDDL